MVPKLSDSSHVTERIHNCALKHSLDRNRPGSIVLGFVHRTVLDSAGGQSVGLHGDRIVNKKFDSDGRKADRTWGARAVRRRFLRKKEPGAVNRETGDDVPSTSQTLQDGRTECGLIELDSRGSVADRQASERFGFPLVVITSW